MKDNIVLIGMPSSGKSTVGVILAKALGWDFIDSDLLIQKKTGEKLSATIKRLGPDAFLELENDVNRNIDAKHAVIAPGGSVVYSDEAMEHFKETAEVIYLQLDYDMLEDRLHDARARGVVLRQGQSLEDLYNERVPLYEKWADLVIPERNTTLEGMVLRILKKLEEEGS